MSIKILSLSYPINTNTPTCGNLPRPEIIPHKSIAAGDTSNVYVITVCNHTGTHVDAQTHFASDRRRLSDYSPEELIFLRPLLVDMPKGPKEWVEKKDLKKAKLRGADCLLIRTGFGALRSKDVYKTHNPGVSPETTLRLRQKFRKIRCIGIDNISISGFQDRTRGSEAHLAAFERSDGLGESLLLIEGMNLALLKSDAKIQKISVVPWFISEIDSAPTLSLRRC